MLYEDLEALIPGITEKMEAFVPPDRKYKQQVISQITDTPKYIFTIDLILTLLLPYSTY